MKSNLPLYSFLILVASAVIGTLLTPVLQPYFEARAFNKFTTGPKATYWDAVWSDLRVTPK